MPNSQGVLKYGNTWESLSNELSPSTTIYASGDLIGGLLTFPDVIQGDIGGGSIVDAIIYDTSTVSVPLELLLFSSAPSTETVTSATGDNGALTLGDTDLPKVCAQIPFSTGNQLLGNDNSIHFSDDPIRSFYLSGSRSLQGLIVCKGTPTYSCGNIMSAKLVVRRDA